MLPSLRLAHACDLMLPTMIHNFVLRVPLPLELSLDSYTHHPLVDCVTLIHEVYLKYICQQKIQLLRVLTTTMHLFFQQESLLMSHYNNEESPFVYISTLAENVGLLVQWLSSSRLAHFSLLFPTF